MVRVFFTAPFTVDPSSGLMVITATLNINPEHPEVHPPPKRLVIDTGSPRTCFFASAEMVADLTKIVPGAKMDVWQQSDGGALTVCRFDPALVTVGGCTENMLVYASTYDMAVKPDFDGLLGMDFLSRFKVEIDARANTISLTER